MTTPGAYRVNLRPLRMISALRVVIAALLVAFGVLLFLSFGKKEEGAVRIHLAQPPNAGEQVVDLSEKFAIVGTKGGREAFRLQADQVTGLVGEKKILQGVHLEVYSEDGDRLALSGDTGQFDMTDKKAQLTGQARVEGKDGFELTAPSLSFDGDRDMIFTPEEIAFKSRGLSGTGKGLNYLIAEKTLKLPSQVRLTMLPGSPGEPEATVTSSEMTLSLTGNDVVFNGSVQMTRGGESFTGDYLQLVMDEAHRKPVSVKAYGQVKATVLTGKDATPASLDSDSVLGTFRADGSGLDRVEAQGNCRLASAGMEGSGNSILAEVPEDRIALRGDPVVVDSRSRIAAQEIDLHPSARGLEARGDVKTSFQGKTAAGREASPAYFSGEEPTFFQSRSLAVEDGGEMVRFSGSVRGWQGDDSIQAEEIIFRFDDRSMKAYRNVFCRFVTQESSSTPPVPASPPTLIMASAMDYEEAEGIVHFRDAVKLTRENSTLLSDRMHVSLTDPQKGRRRVREVLSEGHARFSHLTNSGSADRLTYFPDQELAELQQDAGLAEVVDHTNGRTIKGKTLKFDLKGNRVLTESSDGGRTWITLNPKDKETPGLEPKIGH
jgi:LPS export ABC transporter protein LptC/lipopolysaccharide transport protein LptA